MIYPALEANFVLKGIVAAVSLVLSLSAATADGEINRVVKNGEIGNGYSHGQYPSLGDRTHPGVDIGGGCGLEVIVPVAGVVVRVVDNNDSRFSSVGNAVVIKHLEEEAVIFTTYFHLRETPLVKKGDVSAGRTIGHTGDSGFADGCHLHFEVRRFEGIDTLFHPEFKNIYLDGDHRDTPAFLSDWIDPVTWLNELPIHPNGESIVGHWKAANMDLRMDFLPGGDFTLYDGRENPTEGSYEESSDGKVSVIFFDSDSQARTETFDWEYVVQGNVMSLKVAGVSSDLVMERVSSKGADAKQHISLNEQIRDGMSLAAAAKVAISEFQQEKGQFPNEASQAGIKNISLVSSRYVESVRIKEGGLIQITYGGDADQTIQGQSVYLVPTASNKATVWSCYSDSSIRQYVPRVCAQPLARANTH